MWIITYKKMNVDRDFWPAFVYKIPRSLDTARLTIGMIISLKIASGKKSCYVNVLYHAALSRVKENDSYNWVSDVKQLLCSIGFGDVWYNQGVIDQTGFLCVIKQRLFDIFKQSWSARLVESPRARFYRQVVDQHMFHRLLDIMPCKHRIALNRLIVSSHRLRVETGRWERPVVQYESRVCHVCHKLDDEYHFL